MRYRRFAGVAALLVLLPALALGWQSQVTTTQPAETGASRIDVVADQRIQAMSDFLTGQQQLRFAVEVTYDAVESDGQKIQLARNSRVLVQRPNRLRVESRGDRGWNQLNVFDGGHFLLLDRTRGVYARVATPATLDDFFEFLFEKFGVSPPVADFLLSDVHAVLTGSATSGAVLGPALVGGRECEHLAFSGDLLDWQIWIEKGERPWPRKFVVTYKDIDVRPQFMAVFSEWEAGATPPADAFQTTPPTGATEVPFERFAVEGESASSESATTGTPAEGE